MAALKLEREEWSAERKELLDRLAGLEVVSSLYGAHSMRCRPEVLNLTPLAHVGHCLK